MKKLAIIIVWHGSLPSHFDFWYFSAKNNPTVDFLVFTDQDIKECENIKVYKRSFEWIKETTQNKFDFEIKCQSPMKFCDYRVAYGYIFQEYIKDYDFWAFGDIDLTYGDIRHFITEDILNQYYMIGSWGHLTFYKNIDECNMLFMEKMDGYLYYKDVFSTEIKMGFEEPYHNSIGDLWWNFKREKCYLDVIYDDVAIPQIELDFISNFREKNNFLLFEYSKKTLSRIYLDQKNIIHREPTLYAHFQKRQHIMSIMTDDYENYLIIPNKYIPLINLTPKLIRKLGTVGKIKKLIYYLNNRFRYDVKMYFKSIYNRIK